MDPWVAQHAAAIEADAEARLRSLVDISSPSGDVAGAQACVAAILPWLPAQAEVRRPPCSSPGHAPDLLVRVRGTGSGRVVLLGHLDTVVAHADHVALTDRGDRLLGSGTVDMKGGDVLAIGVLGALAATPAMFAEVVLLLVCDEEWRRHPFTYGERFAGFDACLCFEAGETTDGGDDGVVVRRKAAGTLHVRAHGRAAHSGSAPDSGRNALLALAAAAQAVAAHHDPGSEHRLTAVPTVLHAGTAFNVVPGDGELYGDLRADDEAAFEPVMASLPGEVGGVRLESTWLRIWPGMDARAAAAPAIAAAAEALGRPLHARSRGGASDASHFAAHVPVTIDGLGPRGGLAHNPGEFVTRRTLRERAEVALAVTAAVL